MGFLRHSRKGQGSLQQRNSAKDPCPHYQCDCWTLARAIQLSTCCALSSITGHHLSPLLPVCHTVSSRTLLTLPSSHLRRVWPPGDVWTLRQAWFGWVEQKGIGFYVAAGTSRTRSTRPDDGKPDPSRLQSIPVMPYAAPWLICNFSVSFALRRNLAVLRRLIHSRVVVHEFWNVYFLLSLNVSFAKILFL
jgi:hypothetical protein